MVELSCCEDPNNEQELHMTEKRFGNLAHNARLRVGVALGALAATGAIGTGIAIAESPPASAAPVSSHIVSHDTGTLGATESRTPGAAVDPAGGPQDQSGANVQDQSGGNVGGADVGGSN